MMNLLKITNYLQGNTSRYFVVFNTTSLH